MDCPLKEHTMKQGIREEPGGPIFYFPFLATAISSAVTAGYDLFCATAPSNSRVALRAIKLGQHTEFADAQAELLSLLIMTGSTAPSSGGAPITGVNAKRYSGAATAASSVTGPSTTLASTASATLVLPDSWNVAAGFLYRPPALERIEIGRSGRLIVRMGAVADGLTLNGFMVLQELGQTPQ